MPRIHRYYDVSDLNARWDQIPLQGLGAGILTRGGQGSLSGGYLGALGQDYPWRAESEDTEDLQELVNESLKANGYYPIEVDGKLGPATCGAIRAMCDLAVQRGGRCTVEVPSTCQSFTAPTKKGATPATPPPPPSKEPTDEIPRARKAGMSDTTWLLIGGGVAVAAVGAAFYMRKKKRG